jgi:ribose transport system permease protein
VTVLRVPAFIATLTMLFIGRGLILGLTGGQSILYPIKARDHSWFFQLGEFNAWGFNNQILIAFAVVAIGAVVLAKTRWGYETFATGGNEQAAIYAGIPTRWVRMRAYLISSWCATIAGLMAVAQDKGTSPQAGLMAELIVIASVIIGGASILGGRGRVIGSYLGRFAGRSHQQGAARRLARHPDVGHRRPGSRCRRYSRCRPALSRPSSACS